jgi:hypothetical protein
MRNAAAFATCMLCLAVPVFGCGGDSGEGDRKMTNPAFGLTHEDGELQNGDANGRKNRQSDSERSGVEPGSPTAKQDETEAFRAPAGGDSSVQTFGSAVSSSERTEVVVAMRSFLRSVAATDYPEICAGLTAAAIREVENLSGGSRSCPAVLEAIMAPRRVSGPEAMAAVRGRVYQVRMEDGVAFVLFTPRGGRPSFFVMKREEGKWRATGVAPGQELNRDG